jgi:hypothetical protein
MKKNNLKVLSFLFGLILLGTSFLVGSNAEAASLSGRILLQVQDKGQAWYVDPVSVKRYYLGRAADAFQIMRNFGLGISNKDLDAFLLSKAPARLAGRIILKVQDKGQAYYINPQTLKLHYLGKPEDAFNVIRSLGLGITNTDLNKIVIGNTSLVKIPVTSTTEGTSNTTLNDTNRNFSFKYKNINREVSLKLSSSLYSSYTKSLKVYSYPADNPPVNIREAFYNLFFQTKSRDTAVTDLVNALSALAKNNNWSDEELVESALALVQFIPYDQYKVDAGITNPYFPYETLYLNKGVCSDKTFLALSVLSKLGYGAAILDFPDINHSAVGIACPVEHSIANSGYCYVEMTNYFPIGVIPNSIGGQAQTGDYNFGALFDETKLKTIEILRKSSGKSYQGVGVTKQKVAELDSLYNAIVQLRDGTGFETGAALDYNQKVVLFNQMVKDFYQQ